MIKLRLYVLLLLLVAVSGMGRAASRKVPLRYDNLGELRVTNTAYVRLDEDGLGELEFANKAGKLKMRLRNGLVCADVNCDGQFCAAEIRTASARAGGTLEVPVKIGPRTVKYRMEVSRTSPRYVSLQSKVRLVAVIGGMTLSFWDSNINGRFDDVGKDAFAVTTQKTQAFSSQDTAPVGDIVAIADALYEIAFVGGGKALSISSYRGPRGLLIAKAGQSVRTVRVSLALQGPKSFHVQVEAGETYVIPRGKYDYGQTYASMASGANSMSLYGRGGSVDLGSSRNQVVFGPPFKLGFDALYDSASGKVRIKDAWLKGGGGERYRATGSARGGRKPVLEASIVSDEGETSLGKLEYG